MSIISKEELINIAHISNIKLDDQEIKQLMQQIENVLAYAVRVQEVAGIAEGASMKNINVLREDVVIPTDTKPMLAQAPAREEDYFVVPRILEHK